MTPGYYDIKGGRSVTVLVALTGEELNHYTDLQVAYSHNLTGGSVVHGDHHTPLPFSYVTREENTWKGTEFSNHGGLNTLITGCLGNRGMRTYPAWGDVRSAVYNRALDRFYDLVRSSIDLSTDVAEMGQTRKMIKEAHKAESFIKDRKVKWATKYLEYKFGWLPTLKSIYDAANMLSGYVSNRIEKVTASATMQLSGAEPYLYADQTVPGDQGLTKLTSTARCKITARYQMDPSMSLSRWTSLNPLGIAWELVPYSFVVDWFYDVGGYLRSFENSLLTNPQFISGYVTETYKFAHSTNLELHSGGGFTNFDSYKASSSGKLVQFERSILSGSPSPRAPTFSCDLGSNQIFTIAALIAQHLKLG